MERPLHILIGAAFSLALSLAPALLSNAAAQAPAPANPHCLSIHPDRLALTPDQTARIRDIVAGEPESAHRRAAIMAVLTRTQWQVYWRMAGVAAC